MVWWSGYWHEATPGKKPSGKSTSRRSSKKDSLEGLGNLNDLGGLNDMNGLGGL